MSKDYRSTCPKRTILAVHHTVATWLPVSLDCGHTERIDWTARLGDHIGCTQCASSSEPKTTYVLEVTPEQLEGLKWAVAVSQTYFAERLIIQAESVSFWHESTDPRRDQCLEVAVKTLSDSRRRSALVDMGPAAILTARMNPWILTFVSV